MLKSAFGVAVVTILALLSCAQTTAYAQTIQSMPGAGAPPTTQAVAPAMLNVVLAEVRQRPDLRTSEVSDTAWPLWDQAGAALIDQLCGQLAYVKAGKDTKPSEASLFALSAQVRNLAAEEAPGPLWGQLKRITDQTKRPSLVLLSFPESGVLYLSFVSERASEAEREALAMTFRLGNDLGRLGLTVPPMGGYRLPPCLLRASGQAAASMISPADAERFLQCLAVCEAWVALGEREGKPTDGPAGTALAMLCFDKSKANPSDVNVRRQIGALRLADRAGQQLVLAAIASRAEQDPAWAMSFDSAFARNLAPVLTEPLIAEALRFSAIALGLSQSPHFWSYEQTFPRFLCASHTEWWWGVKVGINIPGLGGITVGGGGSGGSTTQKASDSKDASASASAKLVLTGPDGIPRLIDVPSPIGLSEPEITGLTPNAESVLRERKPWDVESAGARPGGIMLAPNVEVVIDKSGATAATTQRAAEAVKGKPAGGEVDDGGQKTIVVRQPGSQRLFRISAGHFVHEQCDLIVTDSSGMTLGLHRFANSGQSATRGPSGWSFAPYALALGNAGPGLLPGKLRLLDIQGDTETEYELPEKANPDAATRYLARHSQSQPQMVAVGGHYAATFPHGLQAVFDSGGRLQSLARGGAPTVFEYDGVRLRRLLRGALRIELAYDDQGHLAGARGSDGRRVTYLTDADGRIGRASTPDGQSWVYQYTPKGIVTQIEAGQDGQQRVIVANDYDAQGRMLSHRTPAGTWRIAYDDEAARVTVEEPSHRRIISYYDLDRRLVAYGSSPREVVLLNYDAAGRVIQMAMAEQVGEESAGQRPRFRVTKIIAGPSAGAGNAKKG